MDGVERPRVYLAGPQVFLPDAVEVGAARKAACAAAGLEGVFPLDGAPDVSGLSGHDAARALFRHCLDLLATCRAGIADLTPFRGPSADVGTCVEVGWMLATGLPVLGYTQVLADYRDRVADDGLQVEDLGGADNLMVDGAVAASGHPVVRVEVQPGERFRSLAGFDRCVAAAATLLGPGEPAEGRRATPGAG